MLYLSQVLGRPILDLDGERVATLRDVVVKLGLLLVKALLLAISDRLLTVS